MSRAESPRTEPGAQGTRRGFMLGLAIPVSGIVVGAALWWWGTSERDMSTSAADISAGPRGVADVAPGPAATGPESPAIAPAGQLLALQVASFRTRQRAEEVLGQAQNKTGLAGLVVPGDVDGTRWYRILLGTFSTPDEAKRAAEPLLEEGMILDVLVRPVPPRWADATAGQDIP